MFRTRRHALVLAAALAGLGLAGVTPDARAEGECATPTIGAEPAYTRGTSNTVSWTTSDPSLTSFVVQVGSGAFSPATGLATVESTQTVTGTSATFTGLSEGLHSYSVRAAEVPGTCTASLWATPVSTRQDNTAPVNVVTSPEPIGPAHLTTGTGGLRVAGNITDSGGSGPARIWLHLMTTTARDVIGGDRIPPQTMEPPIGGTGNWAHTFTVAPGTYEMFVVGVDAVGNEHWQLMWFVAV